MRSIPVLISASVAGLLVLAACGDTVSPPVDQPNLARSQAIDDQFIVVLEDNAPPGLERRLGAQQGGVLFIYETAIRGFAFKGSEQAAEALSRNPWVAYVEQDREATLHDTQLNPPAWGIDRIDQRDLPLDDSYMYNVDGTGVNIYILDTGINPDHVDFGGRANFIPNGTGGDFVGDGHGDATDCHGHGTHVAGTAAGTTYGVAKGATIYAGRVVNCQGSGDVSMAIAGVDWITLNHGGIPSVVNMSLGYGNVTALQTAVENSVDAGVNYAVSAGNGNFVGIPQDACSQSPANAPSANTVGATAIDDDEASFSNYGPCVDILGPGVSIESAYYSSNVATATMSGTSMSSPHVAGAIALYLDTDPSATPAQVTAALTDNASVDKIRLHRRSRRGGTPNLLLYTAFIGGGTQNQPPTASFTYDCTDLTCDFDGSGSSDDSGIISYSWDFGDGKSSAGVTISHTYAAGGTWTVTLTVTDDSAATGTEVQDVTVTEPGAFSLSAVGYKFRGRHAVDLTWSGATSDDVDVYRDGSLIAENTANDGQYTDAMNSRGEATYDYQVCEAGTTTCSNTATVSFS